MSILEFLSLPFCKLDYIVVELAQPHRSFLLFGLLLYKNLYANHSLKTPLFQWVIVQLACLMKVLAVKSIEQFSNLWEVRYTRMHGRNVQDAVFQCKTPEEAKEKYHELLDILVHHKGIYIGRKAEQKLKASKAERNSQMSRVLTTSSLIAPTPDPLSSPPHGEGHPSVPRHIRTSVCTTRRTSLLLLCRALSCMLNRHRICTIAPITLAYGG
jgi:hypothetical protein